MAKTRRGGVVQSGVIELKHMYRPIWFVGGPYVLDQPDGQETPRMTKPEPYSRPGNGTWSGGSTPEESLAHMKAMRAKAARAARAQKQ